MTGRSKALVVVLAACTASFGGAGCSMPQHVQARTIPARRVCIADFSPGEADRGVGRAFARSLAEHIRRLTSETEVMMASGGALTGLDSSQALRGDRVPVDVLAAAQDRYAADVLVLGRITARDPYFRPMLGVSAAAIDPSDGSVLFVASRQWDAASPDVKRGVDDFYRTATSSDDRRYGRGVYLVSPEYFQRYAAHSLARELVDALADERDDSGS